MKIIKPGKDIHEQDYIAICDRCDCEFIFKIGESELETSEPALIGFVKVKCPSCFHNTWIKELTPYTEMPKRSKANIPQLTDSIWSCTYYFKDDNLDEDNKHKKHDMVILLDNRSKIKTEFVNKVSMSSTSYSAFIAADDPFDAGTKFKQLIKEYDE